MNIAGLQTRLREFAAERDWQAFHTPKNLATALMVEAAELVEIFQWMTPEESRVAHAKPEHKQRIGEEIADVLLYLLQVADHTQVDVAQAVENKLARNAIKYPAVKQVTAVPPKEPESSPVTHVLLDYENVQPSEHDLRTIVPAASKVWVFHGPHQKQVESRFPSYGQGTTAVPISKSGRNALDFHLSFYMGYIFSRNQQAKIVVVANDKGYEPVLEHAKEMGFAVRQVGYGRSNAKAATVAAGSATQTKPKSPVANKAPAKKPSVKKPPAAKKAKAPPAKKVVAKKAPTKQSATKKALPPVSKKTPKVTVATKPATASAAVPSSAIGGSQSVSPAVVQKIVESLRKMGDKRPSKLASLHRALKPLLGQSASDEMIRTSLNRLIPMGVVAVSSDGKISYPKFA